MIERSAEQVTAAVAHHGEGPVWDHVRGVLYAVDVLAGDLLTYPPGAAAPHRRHLAPLLAAVRPRRRGGLVLALELGFALLDDLDDPNGEVRPLPPLWGDRGVRMNDGGCDPAGRFYCGSMATGGAATDPAPVGSGSLYVLDAHLHARPALSGVTISNGLAWSPDGGCAYYVDSATGRVDRLFFDRESGVVTGRQPFLTIAPDAGTPDGLTVDTDGGVWVALWGGGAVHRYLPDGVLDSVVEVPVPYVTACALGGPGLSSLYITTSAAPAGAAGHPGSGALFRADVPVRGLPTAAFAG